MLHSRPITVNEPTWEFLVKELRRIPQDDRPTLFERLGYAKPNSYIASNCLPIIAERPAPFLAEIGIFDRPDLLAHTVISDEEGVEYIITPSAAKGIVARQPSVSLERLYDRQPLDIPLQKALHLFAATGIFDQLERPDPSRYQPDQLQRVLDHFGKGKIQHLKDHRPNFFATTLHGHFLIHETADLPFRAEENGLTERLIALFGPVTPLVGLSKSGREIKSVHQNYRYYLVFSLKPDQPPHPNRGSIPPQTNS